MKDRKQAGARSALDAAAPPKRAAKLGRDIQAKLGQQLRAMYDEVVNQGVPERFAQLINRLDEQGERERQREPE